MPLEERKCGCYGPLLGVFELRKEELEVGWRKVLD
jgi:hypothetical protein